MAFVLDVALEGEQGIQQAIARIGKKLEDAAKEAQDLSLAAEKAVKVIGTDYAKAAANAGAATGSLVKGLEAESKLLQETWQKTQKYNNVLKDQQKLQQLVHKSSKEYRDSLRDQIAQMRHAGTATATLLESKLKLIQREKELQAQSRLFNSSLAQRVRAEEAALKSAKALEESARKRSQRTKELEADLRHLGTAEGKRAVALEQQVKGERDLIAAEQKRSVELKKLQSELDYLKTADGKRQELMKSELALQRQLIQQGAKQSAELRSSENALKRYNSEKQRNIELARLELAEKKKADKAWAEEQLGLKRTTTAVNDHSSSIKRLREEIKFLQSAQGKEYLELKREEAQLKKTRDAMLNFERGVNRAGREVSEFSRRLKIAEQASASFRASLAGVGTHFGMFTSSTIVAASAAYAFSSAIRETISAGSEFEAQMDRVVAVMDATGGQSEYLTNFVRDLAKETVFTAREVSDGLMYLGMAGLDAGEAVEALEPSLRLASIGMLDMGTTADIVTNIMVGMGLEASQIGEIVDDMATAITSSNMDVRQLGNAMSYVAPLAREADISLQEITASLEVLHNSGIKASRAGTAMRTSMLALLAPTAEAMEVLQKYGIQVDDNSGRMRNWTQLLTEMANAQMTLSDIEAIVGKRQAAGMKAMIDSAKATEEWKNRAQELGIELKTTASELAVLTAELERNAGSAEVMKSIMEDNLRGDWLKLLAAVEEKYLQFYAMNETELRALVQKATDFVQELDPADLNNKFHATLDILGTGLQILLAWRATLLSAAAISATIGVAGAVGGGINDINSWRKRRNQSGAGDLSFPPAPPEIVQDIAGPGKFAKLFKWGSKALEIGGAAAGGYLAYDALSGGSDWLSENFNPMDNVPDQETLKRQVAGRKYDGFSETELVRRDAHIDQTIEDLNQQLNTARLALSDARSDQFTQAALDEAERLEAQVTSIENRLDQLKVDKEAISEIRDDKGFFSSQAEASAALATLEAERAALQAQQDSLNAQRDATIAEIEAKLASGEIDKFDAQVERGAARIDASEALTTLTVQLEEYDRKIAETEQRQALLGEQRVQIESRLLSHKEELSNKSAAEVETYWKKVDASRANLTTEQKLASAKKELYQLEDKYLGAHIAQNDLKLMAETNLKNLTEEQLQRRKELLETHKDEFKGLSNTTEMSKRALKLREDIAGYEKEIADERKKAADQQDRDNRLTLRANEQAFKRMISAKQEAEAVRDQYANIEYRNRAYENGILLLDDENYERERAIRLQEEEIQLSIRHLEVELKKKQIGPEGIAALKQEIEYQKDKLDYLKRQKVELSEGVKFGLKQKEAIESMYSTIESETIGLLERGFKDTESFFDSIVGSFKRMLAELAYQAAIKPIMIQAVAGVGNMIGMGPAANAWAADQGVTVGGGFGNLVDMGKSAWSFWKNGGQADVSWFNDFATSSLGTSLGLSTAGAVTTTTSLAGGGVALSSPVPSLAGSALPMSPVPSPVGSFANTVGGKSVTTVAPATMTQGASLFSQGLSYAPWGIVGSLGAGLLGIEGSGNMIIDTVATTGGSILGGMAGAAAASGAFGSSLASLGAAAGPIGAVVGAVLGTALGGVFKKKPSNKEGRATYDLATGDITIGGQSGKKYSQENRDAAESLSELIGGNIIPTLEALAGADIGGEFIVGVGNRDPFRFHYRTEDSTLSGGKWDYGSGRNGSQGNSYGSRVFGNTRDPEKYIDNVTRFFAAEIANLKVGAYDTLGMSGEGYIDTIRRIEGGKTAAEEFGLDFFGYDKLLETVAVLGGAQFTAPDLTSALTDAFNLEGLEGDSLEFADNFIAALNQDLKNAAKDYDSADTEQTLAEVLEGIFTDAVKSLENGDGLAGQVLGDMLTRDIHEAFARADETALETMLRVVGNFELLDKALEDLGHEIQQTGLDAFAFTEKLIELSGGLENLTANLDTYYQNFYSEEERTANSMADLTGALTDLGYGIPPTRMALRELVDAFHEAGDQEAYAAIINNSGAFAQYYAQMEQWTASLFETYRNTIGRDPSAMELYRWLDKLKTGEALFSDVVASLVSGVSEATAHLSEGQIADFQQGALDLYNAYTFTLEVAQEEHALALERISQEEALLKSLRGLIDDLKLSDISPLTPAERLAESARQYQEVLKAVQGGDFSRAGELQSVAQGYLGEASSYYASSGTYEGIFNGVLGSLESLEAQYGTSLNYEERKEALDKELLATQQNASALLEAQLKELAASYDIASDISTIISALPADLAAVLAQAIADNNAVMLEGISASVVAAYTNILGRAPDEAGAQYWQQQLDNGLSVEDMFRGFTQSDEYLSGSGNALEGISLSGVSRDVIDAYVGILGRAPDAAGAYYWQQQLDNGMSVEDIRESMRRSSEYNGSHFSGIESVPYDGYKAVLHRGEKVVPASRAKDDEKSALIAEIRALRAEVTQLREDQNRNAQRAEEAVVVASNMSAQTISQSTKDAIESTSVADRAKVTMR